MTNIEIANFIKAQLKLNSTRAEIEKILTLNRVTPQDIKAAFDLAMAETGSAPGPAPTVPPGLTGIKTTTFPPPTMALNSIDSVTPPATAPAAPAPLPPSYFKSTPPAPPPLNIVSPPAAPVARPSRSGKWLWLFLFLIILALASTAAYAYLLKPTWAQPLLNLLQPTLISVPTDTAPVVPTITEPVVNTDPTAGWLTYKSDIYGYEIKYPLEFRVEKQVLSADVPDVEEISSTDQDYSSRLEIFSRGGFTIKNCLKDSQGKDATSTKDIGDSKFSVYKEKERGTGGRMSLVLGGLRSEYHALHDNQCYIISYTITPNASSTNETVLDSEINKLDQILSTFKFITTPTSPVATSSQATTSSTPPAVDLPSLFLQ